MDASGQELREVALILMKALVECRLAMVRRPGKRERSTETRDFAGLGSPLQPGRKTGRIGHRLIAWGGGLGKKDENGMKRTGNEVRSDLKNMINE